MKLTHDNPVIGYLPDHSRLDSLHLLLRLKRWRGRLHVGTLGAKVHLRVLILLVPLARAAITRLVAMHRLVAFLILRLVLAV